MTLLSLVQSDRGQNIPVGGCFGQMQQPEASVLLRGNAAVPARSRALMDWNGSTSVRLRRRHSRSSSRERKDAARGLAVAPTARLPEEVGLHG